MLAFFSGFRLIFLFIHFAFVTWKFLEQILTKIKKKKKKKIKKKRILVKLKKKRSHIVNIFKKVHENFCKTLIEKKN